MMLDALGLAFPKEEMICDTCDEFEEYCTCGMCGEHCDKCECLETTEAIRKAKEK